MGKFLRVATLFGACLTIGAQAPTGTIAGVVEDESGAVIPQATVRLTNKATGFERATVSSQNGEYSFAALAAGDYEVRAEAKGFRPLVRSAEVLTGSTTRADLRMVVGATAEAVTVEGAAAQIAYESYKLDGVVTRRQIESLPLNGRNFLQLASLEPGVTVNSASLAQYNAQFSVTVLGGDAGRTSINADGGNIRDRTTGNTSQNISQEVVQEFQLSSANFDLSTGITSVGSVNIVTRSGSNDYHGSGYFYFRDHNLAAYPALRRDARNPDPFFARRQSGLSAGGPVKKDRLFFFANYEYNNQDSVSTVTPNASSLASFANISPSPYTNHQLSARVDWRVSSSHLAFFRYTHDGNRSFGANAAPPPMPSNWLVNTNHSDQSIFGLTSTPSPSLVNDFRLSYVYWKNRNLLPDESACPGCLGVGGPQVVIAGAGFTMGNTQNAPQGRDYDTVQFINTTSWQKGGHRMRFGGELERDTTEGFWEFCKPACITVWSPEVTRLRVPGMTLPSSFTTLADLYELPYQQMTVGYGSPLSPAPYQRDKSKYNYRIRAFFQDTWKLASRFTLNYGMSWSAETTLANHDIDKPRYLAPIIGDLAPTRRDWNNIGPALGFAWSPGKSNRTVIRGGAGVYFDTNFLWERLNERNSIGPRGNGRNNVSGALLSNSISGIPGVPVGTPLHLATNPTELRLKHVLQMSSQFDATLARLFPINLTDLSVRGVDAQKSVTGFATIIPTHYPTSYGFHMNLGFQRELVRDTLLQVDFVARNFLRRSFGTVVDFNRWDNARGPVIRPCVGAESQDVRAQCSTGPMQVRFPHARSNYRGLLVKLDKRFSNRYQLTASYAMQNQNAILTIINKENLFDGYGEYGARNVLNVSAIVELPWGFQFSTIASFTGKPPVNPSLVGIDLDGDGTASSWLPGAGVSQFNRGMGLEDFRRLVSEFNTNFAGKRTPRNQLISRVPDIGEFTFDDATFSQDFRLSRVFRFAEQLRLNVFGEVFNAYNVANLGGYGFNLYDSAGFGKPTVRANQVFGSGGPRAFQFGARLSF